MLNHLSTGPDLPYGIRDSVMVPSPEGNSVILVGGYSSSNLDSILTLKANAQGWDEKWTTFSNLRVATTLKWSF